MSIPPKKYPEKLEADLFVNFCKNDANVLEEIYHFHELHYEICFVLKGGCEYAFNYKEYKVSAYEIIFVDKNTAHQSEITSPDTERIIINFNDAYLSKLGLPPITLAEIFQNLVFRLPNKYVSELSQLLTKLVYESDYPSVFSSRLTDGYIYEIFIMLYRLSKDMPAKYSFPINSIVESATKYITQNYSQDLTLSSIAEQCHVNKYYLSKLFKEIMGINLNSYINIIRVHEATRILTETDLSILEVSQACGYNSLKHFCEVFKKIMGVSARDFRKQIKSDN